LGGQGEVCRGEKITDQKVVVKSALRDRVKSRIFRYPTGQALNNGLYGDTRTKGVFQTLARPFRRIRRGKKATKGSFGEQHK